MNPTTPEPHSFLQFWIIIGFIALVIGQIVGLGIMISNRRQRREVSFEFTPASKIEFDQFTTTTNGNFVQIREEMKQDRQANQIHASERSKTLFAQMEHIRTELDTKIEDTRRELASKIDDTPDRIITTLRNTGAI